MVHHILPGRHWTPDFFPIDLLMPGQAQVSCMGSNQQTDQPDMRNEWTLLDPETPCFSNLQDLSFRFHFILGKWLIILVIHLGALFGKTLVLARYSQKHRPAVVGLLDVAVPARPLPPNSNTSTQAKYGCGVQVQLCDMEKSSCRKLNVFVVRLGSLPLGTYVLCYCAAGTGGTAETLVTEMFGEVVWDPIFPRWLRHPSAAARLRRFLGYPFCHHLSICHNLSLKVEKICSNK